MSRAVAVTPATIVIPCGRSAAQRRLAAIGAIQQPNVDNGQLGALLGPSCRQCGGRGPCATALLLGALPGGELLCMSGPPRAPPQGQPPKCLQAGLHSKHSSARPQSPAKAV